LDDRVDYPVELTKDDYNNIKLTVIPTADPDVATDAEKLIKARAQMEFIPLGTVNPKVVTQRVLEAMRVEGIQELMDYQPPPSPETQKMEMEMKLKQADGARKDKESQAKQMLVGLQAQIKQFEATLHAQGVQQEQMADMMERKMNIQMNSAEMVQARKQKHMEFMEAQRRAEQEHIQNVRHTEVENRQKLKQQEKLAAIKAKAAMKAKPKKT